MTLLEILFAVCLVLALALNFALYGVARRFLDAKQELEAIIQASGTVATVERSAAGQVSITQSK